MSTRRDPRTVALAAISGLVVTAAALAALPIAFVTLFQTRRLYARYCASVARVVLRIWGLHIRVHGRPQDGTRQVVYISNHSSTIDLFVLVALGLPNTRFFLSGFLQKMVPLGVLARLMGTFFTVPQNRPVERRRIFARACRVLARTRECVYLSPEGTRVTTGQIGHFNKGAFHLATALGAPLAPFHIFIPREIDPGMGYRAKPGTVVVTFKPLIDTRDWRVEDVVAHKEYVRDLFVTWHRELWHEYSSSRSDSAHARQVAHARA
jgi:1-acyl-sn-glycerol-3-phosphate acyltransferase